MFAGLSVRSKIQAGSPRHESFRAELPTVSPSKNHLGYLVTNAGFPSGASSKEQSLPMEEMQEMPV